MMESDLKQNVDILDQIPPFICKSGKPALALCCSESCQLPNGLVCFDRQCECFKQKHQICQFLRIDHLKTVLTTNRKKISQQKLKSLQAIDQLYLKMIQILSIQRENLQNWIDMYGLGQNCIKLVSLVKEETPQKILGSLGAKILKQVKNYNKKSEEYELTQKQVQSYWQSKEKSFEQILKQIKCMYKQSVRIQSSIINDASSILPFFNRPIVHFKPLFRASQYKFAVSQFHRVCDGVPDTLILIQTQFGKIIGGYTPIKWSSDGSVSYVQDPKEQTFIFSLHDTKKALGNCRSYGPTFGQGQSDIYIPNESNTNKCNFNFPRSYALSSESKNKGRSSQQIFTMFSGSPEGHKAYTKEWEVFQIIWGS